MRFLWLVFLSLIIIPFMSPAFAVDWYDSNWLKARKITIDQTDIDSDLTNYPLYVNMTSVNIGTDSQADCDDFVFVDSTNVTKFDHEIETCDSTNDWAEFWVEVPTVTGASDTVLYIYYDNAGASNQQNTQGVWNSNYQAVYHLNGTFNDSTSNSNTCSNSGSSAITDEYIGDSRDWDGIDDVLTCGTAIDDIHDAGGAVFAWIKPDTDGEGDFGRYVNTAVSGVGGYFYYGNDESAGLMDLGMVSDFNTVNGQWQTTSRDISMDVWSFVVWVYDDDSSSNNPTLYINNVAKTVGSGLTEVNSPSTTYVSDAANVKRIGNENTGVRSWDGGIDEVRFYDVTPSTQWIKADWECQRGAVDGNSCITVGAEGTEPGAGGQTMNLSESATITDTLAFQNSGVMSLTDSATITDDVTLLVGGVMNLAESATITDDLVFLYNDLNPNLTESVSITDDLTFNCGAGCVQQIYNTIVMRVVKDPFLFGIYTNATRMSCDASTLGGVIFNTDVGNLNICDGTNWLLPDGTIS